MTTQKRNHRSVSEIQMILSDQKASGQSQKRFCAERQIPLSTFSRWVSKQGKINPSNLPALIPVGSVPNNTPVIEIELPEGELIRLEPGISGLDLETVLRVLKRC